MRNCEPIICAGDLTERIIIQSRDIKAPTGSSVNYAENFTTFKTVWAKVETTRGTELFDGVNVNNAYTHIFKIRYMANVSRENWIEYKSKAYDIVDVENVNEKNLFMYLRCIERGDKNKNANLN